MVWTAVIQASALFLMSHFADCSLKGSPAQTAARRQGCQAAVGPSARPAPQLS